MCPKDKTCALNGVATLQTDFFMSVCVSVKECFLHLNICSAFVLSRAREMFQRAEEKVREFKMSINGVFSVKLRELTLTLALDTFSFTSRYIRR